MTAPVETVKKYTVVFLSLLGLTALTVAASFADLGNGNSIIALLIAVVQALLVMLYFMHLRHSAGLTKLAVAVGVAWLAVLILITMADFLTRGLLGVPGK